MKIIKVKVCLRNLLSISSALVDLFGGLLWTGAIYSVVSGLLTDFISSRMKRPAMEAKVVIVCFLIILDQISGLIMHGLQYEKSKESAMGVVIIFNTYRALLYSLSTVYIRCNYPIRVFGTLNGINRITMGKSKRKLRELKPSGLTSLANFGLTRLVSTYGENGYMVIILTFSILIILTVSFPILALYNKLKK